MRRLIISTGAALALLLLWGEYENWRSSWRMVGSVTGSSEAVVVLGYRNRGHGANIINRWRVRAGIRSLDPMTVRHCLILCGGSVAGSSSEASVMARYATQACGYDGDLALEELSHSTWENIERAVPLLEEFDRIKIVAEPLHAEKARRYLRRQRPDLAARLVRGSEYRFGERMALKPLLAAHGRWKLHLSGIGTRREGTKSTAHRQEPHPRFDPGWRPLPRSTP